MFHLLLLYCFISFLCTWSGLVFYAVLQRYDGRTAGYQRPLFAYLISGLILLSAFAQWIVLFMPLNLLSLLLAGLMLAAFTYATKNTVLATVREWSAHFRSSSLLITTCFGAFLFMVLTLNTGPVIMDDTHSYHIQAVKWIQEYGTVKGIANLHLRFGFNSSWLVAIGLLSPEWAGPGHYIALNGLLSCWFCHYLLQKSFPSFAIPSKDKVPPQPGSVIDVYLRYAAIFILIAGVIDWPMLRGNATSANYDFISTCCVLFLLLESAGSSRPVLWIEWILWPCYLFTVRMIYAPLLLLSVIAMAFYTRQREQQTPPPTPDSLPDHRHATPKPAPPWGWLVMGLLLFIPFLARNLLLSGYAFFPLYQFDVFPVDWKADKPELEQIMQFIKYYNRANSKIELVLRTPFPAWLPIWFRQLFFYDRILVGLCTLSWAGVILRWKKWTPFFTPVFNGFVVVMLLNNLFWMISAPDPRFNYGCLLAGPCLLLISFSRPTGPQLSTNHNNTNRYFPAFLLSFLTISVLAYTIRKIRIDPSCRNFISPRPLPLPSYKEIWVDGIGLRIPDKILDNWNPRCYDLSLPCLYRVNPRLHARGKDIRDGFRLDGPIRGVNPDIPVGPNNPADFSGEYKLE